MKGRFKPALLAAMAQQQGIPAGIMASGMPGMVNATMARNMAPGRGIAPAPRLSAYGTPNMGRGGAGPAVSPGTPVGKSNFGGLTPARRSAQDDEALRLALKLYGAN